MLWSSDSMVVSNLEPLPDGRGVLFRLCPPSCVSGDVYAFDFRTGAAHRVVENAVLGLHLASGDHPAAVDAVARRLGIDSVLGGATPQDKFAFVERLQREGRVVMMIGDGLNDAPVLARADVSVAIAGGADAAQAQADIVLLGGAGVLRLSAVEEALSVARRAMRVIRQNLAWAVAYNGIALPLATLGWIGPWEAAIGMTASSFIVVINAMRPLAPRGGTQRGERATVLAAG